MQVNYKNIRKIIIFTFTLIIVFASSFNTSYGQSEDISVYIDSEKIHFDSNPILKEGRILVPMRKIFEKLDAEVTWNQETQSVYSEKDNIKTKLTIGNKVININGEDIIIDIAPILHKGTTLVPLRIISESYGLQVNWIDKDREVRIVANPVYVKNKDIKLDIGMSIEDLTSIMGEPSRVDLGQFNTIWYTYNNEPSTYKDYILIKVEENKVRGFETNSKNWILSDIIKINNRFNEIQLKEDFKKKHTGNHYDLKIYPYNVDNTINSFSITERVNSGFTQDEYSIERLKDFEKQIFDMTNVYRVNKNLEPLIWNNAISKFALNHSEDMSKNNYFSHDSLTQSFQDRIQILLIENNWDKCGENLAAGAGNAIIFMNGWYNSEGHRENLLYRDWKYHGVGITVSKDNKIYATQNFTQ